jgi:TPR repeat protein
MFWKFVLVSFLFVLGGQAKEFGWDLGELKTIALQGERSAQLRLGLVYSSGIGANKNYREAFYWFEKAAEQGDPTGALFLARAYKEGMGTHRDSKQVIHWYREAALGSNAFARQKLVALLRTEDNSSIDRVEAYAWCLIANEMGDEQLTKTLNIMTETEASAFVSAAKAKSIELGQAINERKEALRPSPKDPGRGTYQYETGERYFGQVQKGQPHGYGIVDAPNGDRFFGEFRMGRANGYGMLFDKNGRVLFAGLWQNDKAIADDGIALPLAVAGKKN